MTLLRRILAAIVLVLATVGIVSCAAGIIGIWLFRQDVARKVEKIDAKVDVGLQRAASASRGVQQALEKARADVRRVSTDSVDLGRDPEKNRLTAGVLRKFVRQQVGPNISELSGRLATFSDAAVAVASLLESFQELPVGQASLIPPERLEHATDLASRLSTVLQKLQAAIGEEDKAADEREAATAVNDVNLVLQMCQATVDDWQSNLDAAREELGHLKARVIGWLTLAAIAVTVLCAWAEVGQMSLLAHAWKWFRDA